MPALQVVAPTGWADILAAVRSVGWWLLAITGVRLGRLYGRGAWFLLRREAAAARRAIAVPLLVVLAVGSFTFTPHGVAVAV